MSGTMDTPHANTSTHWLDLCGRAAWGILRYIVVPAALFYAWVTVFGPIIVEAIAHFGPTPEGRRFLVTTAGLLVLLYWLVRTALTPRALPARVPSVGRAVRSGAAAHNDLAFPLERRARHEAAHAIAGAASGSMIVSVDVLDVGMRGGQVTADWHRDRPLVDGAWAQMLFAIAGNLVDLDGGHYDQGSSADIQQVLVAATTILSAGRRPTGYVGELTTDALIAGARTRVTQILEQHADVVDAITRRLVEAPNVPLRGQELEELLAPVTSAAQSEVMAGA